jgi:hypothetical protein
MQDVQDSVHNVRSNAGESETRISREPGCGAFENKNEKRRKVGESMKTDKPKVSVHAEDAFECMLAYTEKSHRVEVGRDVERSIKALVTDLGHLCDEYSIDFKAMLHDAEENWRVER